MRATLVIAAMLAALLVIAGCAPKGTPFSGNTATDKEVNAVGADVTEIDVLDVEMGTEDLDTLDQELADIDSLELQ